MIILSFIFSLFLYSKDNLHQNINSFNSKLELVSASVSSADIEELTNLSSRIRLDFTSTYKNEALPYETMLNLYNAYDNLFSLNIPQNIKLSIYQDLDAISNFQQETGGFPHPSILILDIFKIIEEIRDSDNKHYFLKTNSDSYFLILASKLFLLAQYKFNNYDFDNLLNFHATKRGFSEGSVNNFYSLFFPNSIFADLRNIVETTKPDAMIVIVLEALMNLLKLSKENITPHNLSLFLKQTIIPKEFNKTTLSLVILKNIGGKPILSLRVNESSKYLLLGHNLVFDAKLNSIENTNFNAALLFEYEQITFIISQKPSHEFYNRLSTNQAYSFILPRVLNFKSSLPNNFNAINIKPSLLR